MTDTYSPIDDGIAFGGSGEAAFVLEGKSALDKIIAKLEKVGFPVPNAAKNAALKIINASEPDQWVTYLARGTCKTLSEKTLVHQIRKSSGLKKLGVGAATVEFTNDIVEVGSEIETCLCNEEHVAFAAAMAEYTAQMAEHHSKLAMGVLEPGENPPKPPKPPKKPPKSGKRAKKVYEIIWYAELDVSVQSVGAEYRVEVGRDRITIFTECCC